MSPPVVWAVGVGGGGRDDGLSVEVGKKCKLTTDYIRFVDGFARHGRAE